ncbi:MAG: hypothetical protein DMG90_16870 [Acidobacteria bacterium]|jgi:hypothetical protein|nr:MAG: hypothetical protein DMG91_01280 [Acidobacteriota bacterium]PYV87767.1 MAG: hypothetical protein DMG90_16870 [Acidobacteriota bacterium]
MPSRRSALLLMILLLTAFTFAQSSYQSGTLVNIEKHTEYIPQAWHWDTVVAFRTEVKYKLKVRLANDTYLTEYIPDIQPDGPIPSEWKNDKPVEARIADHVLFIKLSYGPEIETHIVKRLKS